MTLVHDRASVATPRTAQLLVAGMWFIKTALTHWSDIAELPPVLFAPVGFQRWLPPTWWSVLLDANVLEGMRFAVLAALGLSLWRAARAVSLLLAGLLLLHHQALRHGFGFVNHQELVPLYAVFLCAFFGFGGRAWEQRAPGLPIIGILLLLCLSYALAGAFRVLHHPELFLNPGAMMGWILLNSSRPLHYGWTLGLNLPWGPGLAWLLQAGLIVVTALEILAPLALVSARFRVVFLTVIPIPFHFACLILMNIFFWENAVLMLLFFDLAQLRHRAVQVLRRLSLRQPTPNA